MAENKFCQSCGMPMKNDAQGGGTETDGSKSLKYCSLCYQDGKFTRSFASANEMQQFVKAKMKEMGFSRLMAWFFTLNIPRLERWSKPSKI
jgi:hypothetical protein